jgi:hypothetical protein
MAWELVEYLEEGLLNPRQVELSVCQSSSNSLAVLKELDPQSEELLEGSFQKDTFASPETAELAVRCWRMQTSQPGAYRSRKAAMKQQVEVVTAQLDEMLFMVAGMWASLLSITVTCVVALAVILMQGTECLETVKKNLASTTDQPNPAEKQLQGAERQLEFTRCT